MGAAHACDLLATAMPVRAMELPRNGPPARRSPVPGSGGQPDPGLGDGGVHPTGRRACPAD